MGKINFCKIFLCGSGTGIEMGIGNRNGHFGHFDFCMFVQVITQLAFFINL